MYGIASRSFEAILHAATARPGRSRCGARSVAGARAAACTPARPRPRA